MNTAVIAIKNDKQEINTIPSMIGAIKPKNIEEPKLSTS